jgi:CRISPR-associated protein Cas2
MALVMIVTRDVADRFHGFLASVMLEISKRVRERTWSVISDWHQHLGTGSIVMVWRDLNEIGGIGIAHLGTPPRELVELDGMWVTRRSRHQNAL